MQSHEVVNMEYLRNIVMRFMEYVYASNWKEANTLTFVIFTVLNFNADEMEVIKRAKETSRFVNGVSRMLYPKSPGVGLSYNTIHTMEGRRRANFAPSAEVSMIESSFSNRENYD